MIQLPNFFFSGSCTLWYISLTLYFNGSFLLALEPYIKNNLGLAVVDGASPSIDSFSRLRLVALNPFGWPTGKNRFGAGVLL